MDLDLELVFLRALRVRGAGDDDKDADVDLLLFIGRGDRDLDTSEGLKDLRRGPRSGLLPLPRPPRPRYELFILSRDLFLCRGGERDREGEKRRRRDGERDIDFDLAEAGERDLDGDPLLRSSLLGPRRSLGT
jgi:hypothetical protein